MPQRYVGQDIGGFGRLAAVNLKKRELAITEKREERAETLGNMQIAQAKYNLEQINNRKMFDTEYMAAISDPAIPPFKRFSVGLQTLDKLSQNPKYAAFVDSSRESLMEDQESVIDRYVAMGDYESANHVANESGFNEQFGITSNYIGPGPKKTELQEMWTNDTENPKFLGTFDLTEIDPKTGGPVLFSKNRTSKPKTKKGSTPATMSKGEDDLRKEFNTLPETKTYTEVDRQIKILGAAMEEVRGTVGQPDESRNLIAVDQALITLFNKMMDPTSVVRESEYARTPGDMAMMNRAKGAVAKVTEGGAGLTDTGREAIFEMATKFGKVAGVKYSEQADFYRGVAERREYNPENIIRITPPVAEEEAEAQPQSMTVDFEGMDVQAKMAPDGFYYIRRGDKYLKYTPEAE